MVRDHNHCSKITDMNLDQENESCNRKHRGPSRPTRTTPRPDVASLILELHAAEADGDLNRAEELRGGVAGLRTAEEAAREALEGTS